jgi:hypothetical protein
VTRKRKVAYPPPRSSKAPPAPNRVPVNPPTLAVINTAAGRGRSDLFVGLRVTILGTGINAGEAAVIERLVGGVIPAVIVRTAAGGTRRVRAIDVAPIGDPARAPGQD